MSQPRCTRKGSSKGIRCPTSRLFWQKAHALALTICEVVDLLPDHERYGLANQLRRGSVSVISNIAGGSARGSDLEFARFDITRSAAIELECQLMLVGDLGYIDSETRDAIVLKVDEISRMLTGLSRQLRPPSSSW